MKKIKLVWLVILMATIPFSQCRNTRQLSKSKVDTQTDSVSVNKESVNSKVFESLLSTFDLHSISAHTNAQLTIERYNVPPVSNNGTIEISGNFKLVTCAGDSLLKFVDSSTGKELYISPDKAIIKKHNAKPQTIPYERIVFSQTATVQQHDSSGTNASVRKQMKDSARLDSGHLKTSSVTEEKKVNSSTNFMSNPWVWIVAFVILGVIATIVKQKF
jgi:hypothetical protein